MGDHLLARCQNWHRGWAVGQDYLQVWSTTEDWLSGMEYRTSGAFALGLSRLEVGSHRRCLLSSGSDLSPEVEEARAHFHDCSRKDCNSVFLDVLNQVVLLSNMADSSTGMMRWCILFF